MPTTETINTLKTFVEAMTATKIPTAVGGGVAVNAYGVKRETTDVDAFLRNEDRHEIFTALQDAGFRIGRVQPPFHYIAMLPGVEDPDVRIDLMFPSGEPEISAIDAPETREVWQINTPVFPITLLVLAKLVAIADAPARGSKDRTDLEELYRIGAFEPKTIRYALTHFDPALLPLFDQIVAPIKSSTRSWGGWHGGRRPH